ncbi:leucine-, glutamate- and lysine-rich protein 1 isoform X1 [Silurus asotus]|uniref:Leucine-, glutamate- and lysine-rich protein 1 isoform X1 n=1 Tax=Silurus asotus TaxID=30991 RepID=A0AAD5A7M6_SILAS|nr:leucine-, glutamate- and lysine-rich protein 1 isoform X1 [Silurus asotus]
MEQDETTCHYCGVSYLIMHEFQRLKKRLREVERQLEMERGSVERERECRVELQRTQAQLEELRETNQLHLDRLKALTLQVSQASREQVDTRVALESECERSLQLRVSGCKKRLEDTSPGVQGLRVNEAGDGHVPRCSGSQCVRSVWRTRPPVFRVSVCKKRLEETSLGCSGSQGVRSAWRTRPRDHEDGARSVCERQRVLLRDAGPVLRRAAAELRGVKQGISLLSDDWNINTTLILQHCSTALTDHVVLQQEVSRAEKEAAKLQQDVKKLQELLHTSQLETQMLENRIQNQEVLQNQKQQAVRKIRPLAYTKHKDGEALKCTQSEEMQQMEDAFRAKLQLADEQKSKLAALVQSTTQELQEEVSTLEALLREREEDLRTMREKASGREEQLLREHEEDLSTMREKASGREEQLLQEREEDLRAVREEASGREEQLLQERQAEVGQLQHQLQELQQEVEELQRAHRDVRLLQETVRRECEERAELTAALSLTREQLLGVRQTAPNSSVPRSPASSSLPSLSVGHSRDSNPGGNNMASWHGNPRQPLPPLPRLTTQRPVPPSPQTQRRKDKR